MKNGKRLFTGALVHRSNVLDGNDYWWLVLHNYDGCTTGWKAWCMTTNKMVFLEDADLEKRVKVAGGIFPLFEIVDNA